MNYFYLFLKLFIKNFYKITILLNYSNFFGFSFNIYLVRFPVPGPISNTVLSAISTQSTICLRTLSSIKNFDLNFFLLLSIFV